MIKLKRKSTLIEVALLAFILIILFLTDRPFSENGNTDSHSLTGFTLPYDLIRPTCKFKLPHFLDEISGISYLGDNRLACIQDEEGSVYIFDCERGVITDRYKFGKERDYEDIQVVDDIAYVLQSNGDILKIKEFEKEDPDDVKKYKTKLSERNNTEGLAYDHETYSLLVACKDSPHLEEKDSALKGKRAVYRFDLNTKELSDEPVYAIDLEYLKYFALKTQGEVSLKKSGKKDDKLDPEHIFDILKEDETFQPSGIAIHPITKDIYIISSTARMLIVLNQMGEIISAHQLNKKLFAQPEGICFTPYGDLFISNESKEGRANILRFKYLY